ncbi:MAG: hypothetical protein ABI454_05105 [Sphingomicrobium sp.]
MRAAIRLLMFAGLALAAACNRQPPQEQNITIADNNLAGAEIETLPPDESSGTPSNQLVNGNDNPDVNDVTSNSD